MMITGTMNKIENFKIRKQHEDTIQQKGNQK